MTGHYNGGRGGNEKAADRLPQSSKFHTLIQDVS